VLLIKEICPMPDFKKLKGKEGRPKVTEPEEIFRRLPKPQGINDLYQSQAEVLRAWYLRRSEPDLVIKLHTGGGKTLVGLLIAQSTLNELGEPVLFLTPTVQLMNQALARAYEYGIPAVAYAKGTEPLPATFTNSQAVLVATYSALFNGQSKFGLRGGQTLPVRVGGIILDDAHTSFAVLRDQFTLKIPSSDDLYSEITALFRAAFQKLDRVGSFDDVVQGADRAVLEVPYWAWEEKREAVHAMLQARAKDLKTAKHYRYIWPLLRDRFHLCHPLVSNTGFTVTPLVTPVEALPTFAEAARRVYMSATIADDSSIVRTFFASEKSVSEPLTSKSLAGVSERMILVPELMPFTVDATSFVKEVSAGLSEARKGVVVLVPSNAAADRWKGATQVPQGTQEVEAAIRDLQEGRSFGPLVLANRYDGIDLPGNSCRLLIMDGLPRGISDYDLFRGSVLMGGRSIISDLSQRIEQGIGRGARGAGDHCVVLLIGRDLVAWISKESNFQFLTASTRAQVQMGAEISRETTDANDLETTIGKCLTRDKDWMEYHAGKLADIITVAMPAVDRLKEARSERKAVELYENGHPEKAVAAIQEFLITAKADNHTKGWFEQLAARFAFMWGDKDLAQRLQTDAYAHNRNLTRPTVIPPYSPLSEPQEQANGIASQVAAYHVRLGFMREFEETVAMLTSSATSNQFEQAFMELGTMLGLSTDRPERYGYPGCDVLWLLPGKIGCVFEAKSRKGKNAFSKKDHGQLLVAVEWFKGAYPEYRPIQVSMHPINKATKNSVSSGAKALTYPKLQELIGDSRAFLSGLCDSQVAGTDLPKVVAQLLDRSNLRSDRLPEEYFLDFVEE
jgi:hypothetical protein